MTATLHELRRELARKPEPVPAAIPRAVQRELLVAYALDDDDARAAFADYARAVAALLKRGAP